MPNNLARPCSRGLCRRIFLVHTIGSKAVSGLCISIFENQIQEKMVKFEPIWNKLDQRGKSLVYSGQSQPAQTGFA